MMMNLSAYSVATRSGCLLKGLPMSEYTPEFRAMMRAYVAKKYGCKVQFRFRGPRNTMVDLLCRSRYTRQSNCIKASATSFAVYMWGNL